MQKSLDIKIAAILANPAGRDFILADAKDADMAFGLASGGKSPEYHGQEGRFRTLAEYREQMRCNTKQGLVDIMLMSASSNEVLAIQERLFEHSHVTPAARANDTTDIHLAMGSVYASQPSRPFRSATIDHIMCGKVECEPDKPFVGADLGLYSMTFNNDLQLDVAQLEAYKAFRIEAEKKNFRHFLEVFNPNAVRAPVADLPRFLNDMITRTLAGVVGKGRPIFLKIPYHGPAAMEALATYDSSIIPGILGGAAGTTYDAFHQLAEARKYGARAALYGRMINNAEDQLTFIQHLRWLADGDITDPAEAVRSYHGSLQGMGVKPFRSLKDDLVWTQRDANYGGGAKPAKSGGSGAPAAAASAKAPVADEPDFSKMSPAEKIAWQKARWDRVLGG